MDARVKLWLEIDGQVVLSDWRVSLLEAVDQTGSLSRAAEVLNVPYRTAWHKLKQMEQRLKLRLVESQSGGAEGGSTRLTADARVLIERYHLFAGGLRQEVDQRFTVAFDDSSGAVQRIRDEERGNEDASVAGRTRTGA